MFDIRMLSSPAPPPTFHVLVLTLLLSIKQLLLHFFPHYLQCQTTLSRLQVKCGDYVECGDCVDYVDCVDHTDCVDYGEGVD